ncbi:hypothetical protein LCGC14_0313300 [marine sediment metagenome]|uniref:Phage portal protein n=1 Tax=marine sediment metagenome TaxID=412755 RepID=A0A0F9WTA8_9ZZZZ
MIDRFKSFWNGLKATPTQGISLISSWLANMAWLIETKFLPLARQAYARNEVVYACLRLLAHGVAEPPMKAFLDGGDKRQELPEGHKLLELMRHPNELMTEYRMWALTTLHLGITGRSVWWKERNMTGQLLALWPLRPDRVGPIYSNSNEPGERVLWGYSYQQPGDAQIISIPRKDVVSFTLPDPAGESGGIVEGLGPLEVLSRQIASDNEATKFVGALLANYAAPTTVLSIKAKLNQETARQVKEHFRAEFGGAMLGTPAVVDGDTTITTIGFNPRQLDLSSIRTVSESRIAGALGVPAILAGLQAGLDAATYNNVSGMRRFFAETTLSNLWRNLQEQYQTDVAAEFDERIITEFDTSEVRALAINRQEALVPIRDGFQDGALTRNEYREALGFEAAPNGDVFLVSANIIEIPAALVKEPVRSYSMPGYAEIETNGHRTEEDILVAGA